MLAQDVMTGGIGLLAPARGDCLKVPGGRIFQLMLEEDLRNSPERSSPTRSMAARLTSPEFKKFPLGSTAHNADDPLAFEPDSPLGCRSLGVAPRGSSRHFPSKAVVLPRVQTYPVRNSDPERSVMYDLIYHKGLVVAHVNLGSVFIETTKVKIATLSEGKIFSLSGQFLGSMRVAGNPSSDRSLSPAFLKVLGIED